MSKTDKAENRGAEGKGAIASMTGFARCEGGDARAAWVWEVKAVNGKGLDLRVRVPYGFEQLEAVARKSAQARLSRGNLTINLNLRGVEGASMPRVNQDALDAVKAAVAELRADAPDMPAPTPE